MTCDWTSHDIDDKYGDRKAAWRCWNLIMACSVITLSTCKSLHTACKLIKFKEVMLLHLGWWPPSSNTQTSCLPMLDALKSTGICAQKWQVYPLSVHLFNCIAHNVAFDRNFSRACTTCVLQSQKKNVSQLSIMRNAVVACDSWGTMYRYTPLTCHKSVADTCSKTYLVRRVLPQPRLLTYSNCQKWNSKYM